MAKQTLYKEVTGNLLTLFGEKQFDLIGHGCNCFNTMGAGIALQVKNLYPQAFEADLNFHSQFIEDFSEGKKKVSKDQLGKASHAHIMNARGESLGVIINMYTQFYPGPDFQLEALKSSLECIQKEILIEGTQLHFGLPLIGCGIGGGNWESVSAVLKKWAEETNTRITVVKL